MYDVIIVGAGPIGLYTAIILEKKLKVLVLEKSQELGKKACSGLYSTNINDVIKFEKGWIEHEVRGAILHSPGVDIKVEKEGTAAFVVNRELFTRGLEKRVKSRIIKNCSVKSIHVGETNVRCRTNQGDYDAKMIIGCDGVNSVVRSHFKQRPQEVVNGLMAVLDKKDSSRHVELWFDAEKLPDGFYWKIPRGKTTEYGMLGSKVTYKQLEAFFKINKYEKQAAPIPIGPCKSYFNRAILIGDAAGITKPWSGGGIMYGIRCADVAKSVIFKAFKQNKFTEQALKEYEDLWKDILGRHITMGMFFRSLLKQMNNKSLDMVFDRFKKRNISKLDMDFPMGDSI